MERRFLLTVAALVAAAVLTEKAPAIAVLIAWSGIAIGAAPDLKNAARKALKAYLRKQRNKA